MSRYLPILLSNIWCALRHPRRFLTSMTDPAALPATLLWLLALGLISGVTGMHAALQGKTSYGQPWTIDLPLAKSVVQAFWFTITDVFWATLLTWFLARLSHDSLRFDVLYVVLGISGFPCIISMLLFPMRDINWLCFHVWQLINIMSFAWAAVLVCIGVQVCLQSKFGKALQCSIPALLMLLTLCIRAHQAQPTSFCAAYPWQSQEGRYVRVYYPRGKSLQEVAAITQGMDKLVLQECDLLAVNPPEFKISLFCFAEDTLQRKLAGADEEPDNTAHSFWDCITLSYDTWDQLHRQLAHELCHVLLANRLTDKVHGLLDEGFCEYVAHQVSPDKDDAPPYAASTIHLRTLARAEVFFDWEQAQEFDETGWEHYTTAQSLVTYLIDKYGVEKFKKFYIASAHIRYSNPEKNPETEKNMETEESKEEDKSFADAVNVSYEITLRQLEDAWRAAMPPPAQKPLTRLNNIPAAFSHTSHLNFDRSLIAKPSFSKPSPRPVFAALRQ